MKVKGKARNGPRRSARSPNGCLAHAARWALRSLCSVMGEAGTLAPKLEFVALVFGPAGVSSRVVRDRLSTDTRRPLATGKNGPCVGSGGISTKSRPIACPERSAATPRSTEQVDSRLFYFGTGGAFACFACEPKVDTCGRQAGGHPWSQSESACRSLINLGCFGSHTRSWI